MSKKLSKVMFSIGLLFCGSFQLTGCVAGNFGLTRDLSGWNRKFNPIIRAILYILLLPVYAITMVFDTLLNNTVEFWTNSPLIAQNQTFEKDGQKFVVQHTRNPLRKTVITIYGKSGVQEAVSELRETSTGSVELYVNHIKVGEASSINDAMVQLTRDGKTEYIPVNDTAPSTGNMALAPAASIIR